MPRISLLDPVGPVTGAEKIAVVQDGDTKRATVDELVAGTDAVLAASLANPTVGPGLTIYRTPLLDAIDAAYNASLGDLIGFFDFPLLMAMPFAQRSAMQDGTSTWDATLAVQKLLDELPDNAPSLLVRLPHLINTEGTLTMTKSVGLVGGLPQIFMDNSFFNIKGTRIRYRGTAGPALTVAPAAIGGNNRFISYLRNFTVHSNRFEDFDPLLGEVLTAAIGGGEIRVEVPVEQGTAAHLFWDHVYVYGAKEYGFYLTGPIYGAEIGNMGAMRTGKAGRRMVALADPIGEFKIRHHRSWQCGEEGADFKEMAGVWDTPGGANIVQGLLSCGENHGPGAVQQAGSFTAQAMQFESNAQSLVGAGKLALYLGSEGGGAGLSAYDIGNLMVAPGANFPGTCVNVTSDARNVTIGSYAGGDTLDGVTGKDFFVAGPGFKLLSPNGGRQPVIQLATSESFVEGAIRGTNLVPPRARANIGVTVPNVTGGDVAYTVVFDNEIEDNTGWFNAATGLLTAQVACTIRAFGTITVGPMVAGHDRGTLNVTTSNRTYAFAFNPQDVSAVGRLSVPFDALCDMDAGDTLSIVLEIGSSTQTVGVLANFTHIFLEAA